MTGLCHSECRETYTSILKDRSPLKNYKRQEGGVTFHTEDSQILDASVQNSAARAIWRPVFVDPR